VGLWVNKQLRDLGDILYTGEVAELKVMTETTGAYRIGAAVPLEDAYALIVRTYPELTELWERFASPPIRNAGTLGGNIANGSPIGDSMPALIALGARVVLRSVRGSRTLPMEDLYIAYQKKGDGGRRIRRGDRSTAASGEPALSRIQGVEALRLRHLRRVRRVRDPPRRRRDRALPGRVRRDGGDTEARAERRGGADRQAVVRSDRSGCRAGTRRRLQAAVRHARQRDYRLRVAQNLVTRFHLETRTDAPLPATAVSVFAEA
jgi:xanthine dehydrogenase small subunit